MSKALYAAIKKESLLECEELLRQPEVQGHINDKIDESGNERGYTLLHVAAKRGNKELLSCLVKNGADIHTLTRDRKTPLHIAAEFCWPEAVDFLCQRGLQPTTKDENGRTALHLLCSAIQRSRKLETAKTLLRIAPQQANEKDWYDKTPLSLAIHNNDVHLVNLLLNIIADMEIIVKGHEFREYLRLVHNDADGKKIQKSLKKAHGEDDLENNLKVLWTEKSIKAPWFHGELSRVEADKLIHTNGDYLMRQSRERKTGIMNYVLTVMWGQPRHYIVQGSEGKWRFERGEFETIEEVIKDLYDSGAHVTRRSEAILKNAIMKKQTSTIENTDGETKNVVEENRLQGTQEKLHEGYIGDQSYKVTVIEVNKSPLCANIRPRMSCTLRISMDSIHLLKWGEGSFQLIWPLRHIRRFGYTKRSFTFEAGRHSLTGEGQFSFAAENGKEILEAVIQKRDLSTEPISMVSPTDEPSEDFSTEFIYGKSPRATYGFEYGKDDTNQSWSKQEKGELVDTNVMRMLIMGNTGAGKTSLTRSIVGGYSYLTDEEDRTVVMECRSWTPDKNKTINIVDMGGHPSYEASGHFFYVDSRNNCSVLCHDISSKEYKKSLYWLKSMLTRSPESHVVFALTKCDSLPDGVTIDQLKEMFIQHAIEFIENEIQQLDLTIKLCKTKKTDVRKIFGKLKQKYSSMKKNIRHSVFVTSCVPKYADTIQQFAEYVLKLSDQKDNKVHLSEADREFYVRIGKLGVKKANMQKYYESSKGGMDEFLFAKRHYISESSSEEDEEEAKEDVYDAVSSVRAQSSQTEEKAVENPFKHKKRQSSKSKVLMYLNFSEVKRIYKEVMDELSPTYVRELTNEDVQQSLGRLHSHGLLIWFKGTSVLENYIFNDLNTFVGLLKSVFRHDIESIFDFKSLSASQKALFNNNETAFATAVNTLKEQGMLSKTLLRLLLLKGESIVDEDLVFDLLEKLDVSYRFKPENHTEEHIFIPWFIQNKDVPDEITDLLTSVKSSGGRQLSLVSRILGNIPRTFFYYLIVRLSKHLLTGSSTQNQQKIWKNGFYIALGKMNMLLQYEEPGCVEFIVQSDITRVTRLDTAWSYIRHVYEESEQLEHLWWPGLVTRTVLVCSHCVIMGQPTPHEYDLSECLNRVTLKDASEAVVCRTTMEDIPALLLQPLPEKDYSHRDQMIQELERFLGKHYELQEPMGTSEYKQIEKRVGFLELSREKEQDRYHKIEKKVENIETVIETDRAALNPDAIKEPALREGYEAFVENIKPSDVIPILLSEGIISLEDKQIIENEVTTDNKVRRILYAVDQKGSRGLEMLETCLRQTLQAFIADKLHSLIKQHQDDSIV